jgi:hypothetical protein
MVQRRDVIGSAHLKSEPAMHFHFKKWKLPGPIIIFPWHLYFAVARKGLRGHVRAIFGSQILAWSECIK